LANFFEYFVFLKNSKIIQHIRNIFVLAKFLDYFDFFEIQKNHNIQNTFVLANFFE
jgi:hypothetical protein